MSSRDVDAFLDKTRSDDSLQELLAAGSLEDFVSAAAKEGLVFTTAELQAALARRAGSAELGDEDLEKVAGGANASGVLGSSVRSQLPRACLSFGGKRGLAE